MDSSGLITKLSQQLSHVASVQSARTAADSATVGVAVPTTTINLELSYNIGMYMPSPVHLHHIARALHPTEQAGQPWAFYTFSFSIE